MKWAQTGPFHCCQLNSEVFFILTDTYSGIISYSVTVSHSHVIDFIASSLPLSSLLNSIDLASHVPRLAEPETRCFRE